MAVLLCFPKENSHLAEIKQVELLLVYSIEHWMEYTDIKALH